MKVTFGVYTYIEKRTKFIKQTNKTEAPFSTFQGKDVEQVKQQLQAVSKRYQKIGFKNS